MSLPTTYNVRNNKASLVGSWVEEDALRDKTGNASRKESWIEPTYERVLLDDKPATITCSSHASEITSPLFETTLRASHRYAGYAAAKPGSGPRKFLRGQLLAETAQRLHSKQRAREREEQQLDCHEAALTTIASSYLPVDTSALVKEPIPRGRDGSLARHHLTKAQTDSIDQMKPDLVQSTTVTSVHQRSALRGLLTLLKGDPDTTRRLLDTLRHGSDARADQPQQEEEREYIGLHDFRTAFVAAEAALPANSAVRGLMTDKEVIHIFVYFDVDSIGAMKLLSVVEFCGGKFPFVSPKTLPWNPYTRTLPATNC
ncbi:hypothetical protein GN244_ATG10333 [Phytophthora infestans]|uniref:Uncharacterized protein n=1 Tax=Phytophthora infestans TaxID=4787 RepID=A0A833SSV2_PHYIN|nr:hypothetical protein GN244_ATG10333 [Phytophthora infestans]